MDDAVLNRLARRGVKRSLRNKSVNKKNNVHQPDLLRIITIYAADLLTYMQKCAADLL
jgi:hypothetical protein